VHVDHRRRVSQMTNELSQQVKVTGLLSSQARAVDPQVRPSMSILAGGASARRLAPERFLPATDPDQATGKSLRPRRQASTVIAQSGDDSGDAVSQLRGHAMDGVSDTDAGLDHGAAPRAAPAMAEVIAQSIGIPRHADGRACRPPILPLFDERGPGETVLPKQGIAIATLTAFG